MPVDLNDPAQAAVVQQLQNLSAKRHGRSRPSELPNAYLAILANSQKWAIKTLADVLETTPQNIRNKVQRGQLWLDAQNRPFAELHPDMPIAPGPPPPTRGRKRNPLQTSKGLQIPDIAQLHSQAAAEVKELAARFADKEQAAQLAQWSRIIADADADHEQALADRAKYAWSLSLHESDHGPFALARAGNWPSDHVFVLERNQAIQLTTSQFKAMSPQDLEKHALTVGVPTIKNAEAKFHDAACRVIASRERATRARELRADLLIQMVEVRPNGRLVGIEKLAKITGLTGPAIGGIIRRRQSGKG